MICMGSELWQRLRAARINAGLTQEQVAEAFSVSKSAVSQWEKPARGNQKKAYPTRDKLVRFAALTSAPLNWLIDDASDPIPATPPAAAGGEAAPAAGAGEAPIDLAAVESMLDGLSPTARDHVERIAELAREGTLSDADLGALLHLLERKTSRE